MPGPGHNRRRSFFIGCLAIPTWIMAWCCTTLASEILPLASKPTVIAENAQFNTQAEGAERFRQTFDIPMRDAVKLATDLYFPTTEESKISAILIRTPYGKREAVSVEAALRFTQHGHVVAVQDVRGRFDSEGSFGVMFNDAEDGYDTIDWLAGQRWSSGRVGTFGCSYRGAVQLYQAGLRNPHLKAMIPEAAPGGGLGFAGGEPRHLGIRVGGAFVLASTFSFFWHSGSKIHYKAPVGTSAEIKEYFDPTPQLPPIDLTEALWSLPLIDLPTRFGAPPTDWNDILTRTHDDPWWSAGSYLDDSSKPDVPTLSINSWYDTNIAHTLYRFNLFRRNSASQHARDNQYLIVSPTRHCNSDQATEHTIVGERDLGDARLGLRDIQIRWFDHWLKGIDSEVLHMPRVQYFVMGENKWHSADEWPLPGTQVTDYYLHSDGRANSRFGTGVLSTEPPPESAEPDRFTYDPATPVPSKVGPLGELGGGPIAGPVDNRDVEMRHDVLVYTSKPLEENLEVTGSVEIVLYVSSSRRDTDFTAKLLDVYPDGRAYNLTEGILRARYREGYDHRVWMQPDEVYRIEFQLRPTSNRFSAGHRIRLEISSSNFPQYDRNLNTGGNNFDETTWVVAENTVHHSRKFQSHVKLPVIPAGLPEK